TPLDGLIDDETVDRMKCGLRPNHREIIELIRKGYTVKEISALLGIPERTVRRVLERLKKRCRTEPCEFPSRRDVGKADAAPQNEDAASWLTEAIDREPTPLEAAVFDETVEQMMSRLTARGRTIIELSLQGYTVPDISTQLDCSECTV